MIFIESSTNQAEVIFKETNKPVFCIPNQIGEKSGVGTNNLIKIGANRIIEEATIEASKQKDEIVESAKADIEKEKEKAREELAMEVESSKDAIHAEIVDVALKASEELLSREVTSKDNKRLLDDFVNELNKDEDK